MDLKDKIVVVTGASAGLGLAFARILVDKRAQVFGLSRRREILEAIRDELGERFHPLPCDVTDEVQVKMAFEAIEREAGRLDVLINNAGLGKFGPVDGFLLRCVYARRRVSTPNGTLTFAGLRAAQLEPYGLPVSEEIDEATAPGSRLSSRLADVDPEKTVVTVIAYPDSFDALPDLESALQERGFRVAKALQEAGKPITFGPGGRKALLQ